MRSRFIAAALFLLLRRTPAQEEETSATNPARLSPWAAANANLLVGDHNATDPRLFVHFASRPDIVAHRWEIDIYDEDALAPGYWFVAPYRLVSNIDHDPWTGPTIYDGNGQLIWSGAPSFGLNNAYDFRVSVVDGKDMLSLIAPWDSVYKKTELLLGGHDQSGIILDDSYRLYQSVDIERQMIVNMHEFNVKDNGSTVLALFRTHYGLNNESCMVVYPGFREIDLVTGDLLFHWDSLDHIPISESTYMVGSLEEMCNTGFDVTHLNSVDKFANGDYLLSARNTDTVYRISQVDGSIVWRLGGRQSDFVMSDGAHFTRQHHARIYSENETHIMVTLFNNAFSGITDEGGRPSNNVSSGLLLSLHIGVVPMVAELVSAYHHPEDWLVSARGSMQFVRNGNAFLGWAQRVILSEHAADGRLLMRAKVIDIDTNTYRAYKFPWVGRPSQPPDIHSSAFIDHQGSVATKVHASWNGATEVAMWTLIHSDEAGEELEIIDSAPRQGFETMLLASGLLEYVVVAALDEQGVEIGRSMVNKTLLPNDVLEMPETEQVSWRLTHAVKPSETHGWLLYIQWSISLLIVMCFVLSRKRVKALLSGYQRVRS